ncbi:hypothetical protein [Streptomyces sp. ODS28]|uniref:hypothetical protein n=1 Tax=Streptomyces sp. ODS28 TaxID=3136688 RepID=UPI0031ED109C
MPNHSPSLRMWWAELLLFLAVTAVSALGMALAFSAVFHVSPVIDGVGLAVAIGIGLYAARRFRAWGLRRGPGSGA